MNSTRRGFLSFLLPVLASIPGVGKLFCADDRLVEGRDYIVLPEVELQSVSEISCSHEMNWKTGSGSDGNNCFSGEWISVNDRLPRLDHSWSGPDGKTLVSFSCDVLISQPRYCGRVCSACLV